MLAAVLIGALQAPTSAREYAPGRLLANLEELEVTESSGMAPSRRVRGAFYTHNDSGDRPRFFRFDEKGRALGTWEVRNAEATDWEEMASARLDGKDYLFFADVGDNLERRGWVTLYRVPEPGSGDVALADQTYRLRYPDRAHNCEAILVHPFTGDIQLITKTAKGPSLVFGLPRPRESGEFTLRKLGEVEVPTPGGSRLVTGAAVSPDGRHVAVRTYSGACEYEVGRDFNGWFRSTGRPVPLPRERQGEAITYDLAGKRLLTTSEGKPCPVSEVAIR